MCSDQESSLFKSAHMSKWMRFFSYKQHNDQMKHAQPWISCHEFRLFYFYTLLNWSLWMHFINTKHLSLGCSAVGVCFQKFCCFCFKSEQICCPRRPQLEKFASNWSIRREENCTQNLCKHCHSNTKHRWTKHESASTVYTFTGTVCALPLILFRFILPVWWISIRSFGTFYIFANDG